MSGAPKIELHKILVPVDFSPASRNGLQFAAALAKRFHSRLHLVHVIEPAPYPEWGYVHLTLEEMKMRELAQQKLPQFSLEAGIEPELVRGADIRAGEADLNIVKTAGKEEVDLIVLASHGKSALAHVLLGSTAERVARLATCPVLVVREQVLKEHPVSIRTFQTNRILVPTDYSALSMKALVYATAFARRFDATLVLVHVVPEVLPAEFGHLGVIVDERRVAQEAEKRLQQLRESACDADLKVETRLLTGGASYEINRAATDLNCDLIVLGTHGYRGFRRIWLGSVSEKVVHHAPCPVLVVREKEHEFIE
jgi:nucleotide-binding universal stress UspA family protein